METLFRTGYEKIMNIFYNDKSAKIHLREIARKAKLNENSVSISLNQLEKNKLLKSEKEGNLKKYSIEKNTLVFLFFSFFDIAKFGSLPIVRKKAVDYFIEALEIKPIIVVLFGSTAKENFTKNSDMDLMLVVNEKLKISKSQNYSESQTGIKINALQISYGNFIRELIIKEDNVVQSAIKTGYPVFNHLAYYKEILK